MKKQPSAVEYALVILLVAVASVAAVQVIAP